MKYVIYKEAIDDYGQGDTIKFDKLEDAQSWWKEWFGNSFEYAVDISFPMRIRLEFL